MQDLRCARLPARTQLPANGTVVRLAGDHPACTAQAVSSEETRKALAADV